MEQSLEEISQDNKEIFEQLSRALNEKKESEAQMAAQLQAIEEMNG